MPGQGGGRLEGSSGTFLLQRSTEIRGRTINRIHCFVCDVITHPCPNSNVGVRQEWVLHPTNFRFSMPDELLSVQRSSLKGHQEVQ